MTAADWTKRHAELWADLVPDRGQASTVQGEIIRMTGRLADEANRNGNVNWDAGHENWCDYLESTLTGVWTSAGSSHAPFPGRGARDVRDVAA
jgi:hypothetical protein